MDFKIAASCDMEVGFLRTGSGPRTLWDSKGTMRATCFSPESQSSKLPSS